MNLEMQSTVSALLAPGKGILAADESQPTIGKRFKEFGIPSTEESRRAYREMLFTTPGLSPFISGAILFDETLRQHTKAGKSMPEVLKELGIVPGIKVDQGTAAFGEVAGEKITGGLDGLQDRLGAYRDLGARFTKWRAVIGIGDQTPTRACLEANARSLGFFAALSQEAGLVPIVEPEVLMDGNHTIEECEEVTGETLLCVFQALAEHKVALPHMLLKSGMVLSGADCPRQAGVAEVAEATRRCFRSVVPNGVPGIVLLSGGQSDQMATERLNALCQLNEVPWKVSFSFGRALQAPALRIWKGAPENQAAAQAALHHRAQCNSLAVQGKYSPALETVHP